MHDGRGQIDREPCLGGCSLFVCVADVFASSQLFAPKLDTRLCVEPGRGYLSRQKVCTATAASAGAPPLGFLATPASSSSLRFYRPAAHNHRLHRLRLRHHHRLCQPLAKLQRGRSAPRVERHNLSLLRIGPHSGDPAAAAAAASRRCAAAVAAAAGASFARSVCDRGRRREHGGTEREG